MRNLLKLFILAVSFPLAAAYCTKPANPDNGNGSGNTSAFQEAIPDTLKFTEATFTYNGDYVGDGISDGWIIKLYTETSTMQILINTRYNESQKADISMIEGIYTEMVNSGNYTAGTFVSGSTIRVDLPGGDIIDVAEPTFFAGLTEDNSDLFYDFIDEGVLSITSDDDGIYTIEGVLVGNKFTKRYIKWSGEAVAQTNVQEVIPNSTISEDLTDLTFTRGQLQDKGDYFYLRDNSYRCLLLYLVDDDADLQYSRPGGTSRVLRLEFLVPWETDYNEGIPAGTYEMVPRNPDTSMDRDKIVPGGAVAGLPNVFEAWKMAGSWYYEMEEGTWTGTYARIDKGTISVTRGEDGSHSITYDLMDCQSPAKGIKGLTELDILEIR